MTPGEAVVRFYIDADILGLAKVLAELRNDITYPGDPGTVIYKRRRPACPITSPEGLDPDWIPEVASRGWLIVTRDIGRTAPCCGRPFSTCAQCLSSSLPLAVMGPARPG